MTDSRIKLLRNSAAALRSKAASGKLEAVSLRQAGRTVGLELTKAVEEAFRSGALTQRWHDAVQTAAREGLAGEEVHVAALGEVLMHFARETGKRLTEVANRAEGECTHMEGRAAGIEDALAQLAPEEPQEDPPAAG